MPSRFGIAKTRAKKLKQWARAIFLAGVTGAMTLAGAGLFANTVDYTGGATADGTGDNSPINIAATPGAGESVAITVNTQNLTGPFADTIRVDATDGAVNLNVNTGRNVSGGTATGASLNTTTGDVTAVINGGLTSAVDALVIDAGGVLDGGDVSVSGTGTLGSGTNTGDGLRITVDVGAVTVNGFGSIQGASGIFIVSAGTNAANAGGDINLGTTAALGTITARNGTGILVTEAVNANGEGNVTIVATNINATNGWGILLGLNSGDSNVTVSGDVATTGAFSGIDISSTTGNVLVDGAGTGAIDAGDVGVNVVTDSGNVTIVDFAQITGASNGIGVVTDGVTTIDGVQAATGTAGAGIVVNTVGNGGAVNIGQNTANGPIIGATNGVEAYSAGANAINVDVDANVTGTASNGVLLQSVNGVINLNVNAGTVAGDTGVRLVTTGTGNANLTVVAGARIEGVGNALQTVMGGDLLVNNAGTMTTTGDTGAANVAGGDVIDCNLGDNVVNNTGLIVGRFDTTGANAFTFNNQTGGVWTPGTLATTFFATTDTVNNAGTINIRTGTTDFTGLENFTNQTGGLINLAYSSAATDNLIVDDFTTQAGSALRFNFSPTAANNAGDGFDNTSNGQGTADTIVVNGAATPAANTAVEIVKAQGTPSARGSVALVYTGTDLNAPTFGAPIQTSQFYRFGGGDPTTAATRFFLVDDGNGGVFLQWLPNVTRYSAGGFMGGHLGGEGGPGSGMAQTAGRMGPGLGGTGGFGGPSGGGAFGRISDASASSTAGDCECSAISNNYWFLSNGTVANFNNVGSGSMYGFAVGGERQVRNAGSVANAAIGLFAHAGGSDFNWTTGQSRDISYGGGAYFRAKGESGSYMTALASLTGFESDMNNRVFNSTADQNGLGWLTGGSIGRMVSVTEVADLDFRAFATYGNVRGAAFVDSNGLPVDRTNSGMVTLGAMTGLQRRLSESAVAYARTGVKWFSLHRDLKVEDLVVSGEANSMAASVAGGLAQALSQRSSLDIFTFGDFGDRYQSGGGMVTLVIMR